MKSDAHSRNLRKHRVSDAAATFFVTKSLQPKKPILDAATREVIVSALDFAIRQQRIYLRAFVVMPDHWHALFALRQCWTLPKFMHNMMSFVAARTVALLKQHAVTWQDSYYDTRITTTRQFQYVAYYIEQNPVAKGLVKQPHQWDASSGKHKELVTDPWPLDYD